MGEKRPFPLHAGVARVTATEWLGPGMQRVTLGHERFGPGFGAEHPGEVITLGWPGADERLTPPDRGLRVWTWYVTSYRSQHWRNYTVRSHDPGAATIDVDFALHDGSSVACDWARRAAPGDELGFAGPRADWTPAPGAPWSLLVADETGLPALTAIAETLPAGRPVLAVVETERAGDHPVPAVAADGDWRWVTRDGRPDEHRLRDAVAALDLPPGPGHAWAGAESAAVKACRRWLKDERPDVTVSMRGYWKRRG